CIPNIAVGLQVGVGLCVRAGVIVVRLVKRQRPDRVGSAEYPVRGRDELLLDVQRGSCSFFQYNTLPGLGTVVVVTAVPAPDGEIAVLCNVRSPTHSVQTD